MRSPVPPRGDEPDRLLFAPSPTAFYDIVRSPLLCKASAAIVLYRGRAFAYIGHLLCWAA
jgi:hypothetical protein